MTEPSASEVVLSPKAPRVVLFLTWGMFAIGTSYLVSLPAPGMGRMLVFWALFACLLVIGGHRCRGLKLVLGPTFVRVVNPFRTHLVPLEPPFQITLRRLAMPANANLRRKWRRRWQLRREQQIVPEIDRQPSPEGGRPGRRWR